MRSKNYISRLSEKDERFCFVLKSSHNISEAAALGLISKHRLESYRKQGVIKKIHYIHNNRQHSGYMLTGKGINWIKAKFPQLGDNFYQAGTAVRHNMLLAEHVIQHSQDREWLNERDLRDELYSRLDQLTDPEERFRVLSRLERGEISVPDGGYVDNGELHCIEIVTNNYTAATLESKAAFGEFMGCSIDYIRQ